MRGWYVAKSKAQKEHWLMRCLTPLGVEAFYPKFIQVRGGKRLLEPVFPTYVFCRFDPQTPQWPAIRWAPGLAYFLGVEANPARLDDALIEDLRARVEDWNAGGYKQQF